MTEPEKLACIFKVLSVDTRVRMIDLLKHRSLCVNALARALEITPAAVSQHLRVLRDANIVTADKRGYFVHYRVKEATLVEWNQAAKELLEGEAARDRPGNSGVRKTGSAERGRATPILFLLHPLMSRSAWPRWNDSCMTNACPTQRWLRLPLRTFSSRRSIRFSMGTVEG